MLANPYRRSIQPYKNDGVMDNNARCFLILAQTPSIDLHAPFLWTVPFSFLSTIVLPSDMNCPRGIILMRFLLLRHSTFQIFTFRSTIAVWISYKKSSTVLLLEHE